jgi:hypothetical protein
LYLVLLAGLAACGGNGAEAITETPPDDPVPAVIDLSSEDMPLLLAPPQPGELGGDSVQVSWNDEFGHLEVHGGDHFGLQISEEPGDVGRMKADLERDMLRKHTLIEDAPDRLVYRSAFPDDPDLVFVHFYRVLQADGRTFVVESDPMGRFNEADVRRMVEAVAPKDPV